MRPRTARVGSPVHVNGLVHRHLPSAVPGNAAPGATNGTTQCMHPGTWIHCVRNDGDQSREGSTRLKRHLHPTFRLRPGSGARPGAVCVSTEVAE